MGWCAVLFQRPEVKERFARFEMTGMAWVSMKGEVKGTLIEKMREAMKEEETLPGNDRLAHLVSLVSRHVNGDAAAAIDEALAKYVSKKRSLRASVLSGVADCDKLRQELAEAVGKLELAVAKGVESIDLALNEIAEAQPPREGNFETQTAAEIFADIVNENIDSVKGSFSGLIGKGKIAIAFSNAKKDDVNHQDDGHRKERTNRL